MENKLPLPTNSVLSVSKVFPTTTGGPGDPAISFSSDSKTGWYMNESGEVIFTSGMDDVAIQNTNYSEFKKPIMIAEFEPGIIDLTGKGILYKKIDNNGLWWKTTDGEVNLATGLVFASVNPNMNLMTLSNSESNVQLSSMNNQSDAQLSALPSVMSMQKTIDVNNSQSKLDNQQLDKQQIDNQQLNQQLNNQQIDNQQIDKQQLDNQQLDNSLNKLKNMILNNKIQVDNSIDNLQNQINFIQTDIPKCQDQLSILQTQLSKVELDLVNKDLQLDETRFPGPIVNYQEQLDQLQMQITDYNKINTQLSTDVRQNIKNYSELYTITNQNKELNDKFQDKLQDDLNSLQNKLNNMQSTLSNMQSTLTDRIELQSQKNSELLEKFKLITDVSGSNNKELLDLFETNKLLQQKQENQINALMENYNSQKTEFSTNQSVLQTQIVSQIEIMNSLQDQLNQCNLCIKDFNNFGSKISENERKTQDINDLIASKSAMLDRLYARVDKIIENMDNKTYNTNQNNYRQDNIDSSVDLRAIADFVTGSKGAIEIKDVLSVDVSSKTSGFLFKKPDNPGLWWKFGNNEVDLTKLQVSDIKNLQIKDTEIVANAPFKVQEISFTSNAKTGINNNEGFLNLKSCGTTAISLDSNIIDCKLPVKTQEIVFAPDAKVSFNGTAESISVNSNQNKLVEFNTDASIINNKLQTNKGIQLEKFTIDNSENFLNIKNSNNAIMHISESTVQITPGIVSGPVAGNVPNYSFIGNTESGMSSVNGDVVLKSANNNVVVQSPLFLERDLILPTGTLSCKNSAGNSGLYWKSGESEINILDRGLARLPDLLKMPSGDVGVPSYGFINAPGTGMAHDNELLTFSVGHKPIIEVASYGLNITGRLGVRDKQGKEIGLYKKNTEEDLYAILPNGVEVNITNKDLSWPMNVPENSTIELGNHQIKHSNGVLDISSMHLYDKKISIEKPIEMLDIPDENVPLDDNVNSGILYKDKDSLIWLSRGIKHNLIGEKYTFKASSAGNIQKPEYSFAADTDTGILRLDEDTIGTVAGGQLVAVNAADQTILYKPLTFSDANYFGDHAESNIVEGKLYKKRGTDKLIWNTASGDVDLTEIKFPLKAPNSTSLSPTYGFNEDGYGLYKAGGTVGISVNNVPIFISHQEGVNITGSISMNYGGNVGTIDIRDGELCWNGKNLREPISYPLMAVKTDVGIPEYSFEKNPKLGMTSTDNEILFIGNSGMLAKFGEISVIPSLEVQTLNLQCGATVSSMFVRGDSLIWKNNGIEHRLDKQETTQPSISKIGMYDLVTNADQNFAIELDGKSILTVSTDGMETTSITMPGNRISEYNTGLSVENGRGVYFSITDTKMELLADTIDISDGSIVNVKQDLYWVVGDKSINLSDKSVKFPIKAPKQQNSYGFVGSAAGIGLDGTALVLKSENATAILENDGFITTSGINTNKILAPNGLNIQSGEQNINILNNKVEIDSVYRSKNEGLVFGYDLPTHSIGIKPVGNTLGLISGESSVDISDNKFDLKKRLIVLDGAVLEKRGNDLFWKSSISETQLNQSINSYSEKIQFIASDTVNEGDVLCLEPNGSGKVCKALGLGVTQLFNTSAFNGTCNSFNVFNYNDSSYVLVTLRNILVNNVTEIICIMHLCSIETNVIQKSYTIQLTNGDYKTNDLENGFSSIVQIEWNSFVAMYATTKSQTVKITKIVNPFTSPVRSNMDLVFSEVFGNMTCLYDTNYDCIIVGAHSPSSQNLMVALISGGKNSTNLQIGTIDSSVVHMSVVESDKQMYIVAVPGGSYVLSYGAMKVVFVISDYKAAITAGETFLDYESIDCAGMIYDQKNGVILSLEKTISSSGYIQILDVLGMSIQKLGSKTFRSMSLEFLGIAYNELSDMYAVLYSDNNDNSVYLQLFEYDSTNVSLGLRYKNNIKPFTKPEHGKRGNYVHEIPTTAKLLYGFDNDVLVSAELGKNGYPAGYVGVANNKTLANELCSVTIKGHIYTGSTLPSSWLGKKIYLEDPTKNYPTGFTINPNNSVFIGTCLDSNKILLGL